MLKSGDVDAVFILFQLFSKFEVVSKQIILKVYLESAVMEGSESRRVGKC